MGKKKKFKRIESVRRLPSASKRNVTQSRKEGEGALEISKQYSDQVTEIAHAGGEFSNVNCSQTKHDIVDAMEPVFFMNNSICNVPSPLSVPAKVYTDSIRETSELVRQLNKKLPYHDGVEAKRFSLDLAIRELVSSITNLIISSLYECINHILDSDIFITRPEYSGTFIIQVLQYETIHNMLERKIGTGYTLYNVRDALENGDPTMSVILNQTEFCTQTTAIATQVFAEFANRLASKFAFCIDMELLNPRSKVYASLNTLNLFAGCERNELFAMISAMMTNYTWSFSGLVEVEISRIMVSIVYNYGSVSTNMSEILEEKGRNDDWE